MGERVLHVPWRVVRQSKSSGWCIVVDHEKAGFRATEPVATRLDRVFAQHLVELHNASLPAVRDAEGPGPVRWSVIAANDDVTVVVGPFDTRTEAIGTMNALAPVRGGELLVEDAQLVRTRQQAESLLKESQDATDQLSREWRPSTSWGTGE